MKRALDNPFLVHWPLPGVTSCIFSQQKQCAPREVDDTSLCACVTLVWYLHISHSAALSTPVVWTWNCGHINLTRINRQVLQHIHFNLDWFPFTFLVKSLTLSIDQGQSWTSLAAWICWHFAASSHWWTLCSAFLSSSSCSISSHMSLSNFASCFHCNAFSSSISGGFHFKSWKVSCRGGAEAFPLFAAWMHPIGSNSSTSLSVAVDSVSLLEVLPLCSTESCNEVHARLSGSLTQAASSHSFLVAIFCLQHRTWNW